MKWLTIICATIAWFVLLGCGREKEVKLKIVAFNDFHGYLESPGKMRANEQSEPVDVGGADYLAGYTEHLKSENPNNVVVSAGDLIGASPLVSSLFDNESTIEAMNRLGLEISAVGNHEFDKGPRELLRMRNGGCSTSDQNGCKGQAAGTPVPFEGAKFEFLAANVFDSSSGKNLFSEYAIKTYNGVKVAFIGLTLKDTPATESPSAVAGLRFDDEAGTINRVIGQLRQQGVKAVVVLIHEGGLQATKEAPDINGCAGGLSGSPIQSIISKLDDDVDLVISAHTHGAYICQLPNAAGRKIFVTSAASYGRVLTDIDLTLDTKTKDVKSVRAKNILVERAETAGIVPDASVKKIVDAYTALAAPIANRKVGSIRADLTRDQNAAGESLMGELIADSQMEATSAPGAGGAVVSFMNPGGIRADIPFAFGAPGLGNGAVTFSEIYNVQPFGDTLVTMTLTGTQIKTLLEEQFKGCALGAQSPDAVAPSINRMLQVSTGFSYTWHATGAACNKVDAASMKLNDARIAPAATYRVTVNSFIADGGDQFYVLRDGVHRLGGPIDIEAMDAYFAKHSSITPSVLRRVIVIP